MQYNEKLSVRARVLAQSERLDLSSSDGAPTREELNSRGAARVELRAWVVCEEFDEDDACALVEPVRVHKEVREIARLIAISAKVADVAST